jgi:hypothetical protein
VTGHKAASEKRVSGFVKIEPPLLKRSNFSLLLKTRHRFTRKGKKEDLFLPVRQKKMELLLNT